MQNQNTNTLRGLSEKEAAALFLTYGPNAVELERGQSPFMLFLSTFKNPLILLLIVTSSLAAYFGDVRSFFTILTMILLSSVLEFHKVYKSDKAAQKLKDRVKILATVIRDGKKKELSLEQLVPTDLRMALTASPSIRGILARRSQSTKFS